MFLTTAKGISREKKKGMCSFIFFSVAPLEASVKKLMFLIPFKI